MPRLLIAGLAATALLAAIPAVASAEYYISQKRAEQFTRHAAGERYGTRYEDGSRVIYGASCRPQGLDRPRPGYIYHRWTCWWADESCEGKLLIVGSRGAGRYYSKVLRGQRCTY
jgi:hypothetical protein